MIEECLEGVRVLDLSQYLPGPYATQILADLGADVVKVEPPSGDPGRSMAPQDPDGAGVSYKLNNRGKTRLVIDLKDMAGKAVFAELIVAADVLLESYRPGVMDRLGFDRDRLKELNPGLIICSLTGYGQNGPMRDAAGHDINYMALGGALIGVGSAERGPMIVYPPVADRASGMTSVIAILGALIRRGRTGAGAHIDVSIAEAALAWQAGTLTAARGGQEVTREGLMVNGGAGCYNIYATSDGRYVTLGPIEPKFWANFCNAAGHPEWIDRQFEPMPQTGLIGEIKAMFAARPLKEWDALLGKVDCCYQAVLTAEEVSSHPHLAARGAVVRHEPAGEGFAPIDEVPFPAQFDGAPTGARAALVDGDLFEVRARWTDNRVNP